MLHHHTTDHPEMTFYTSSAHHRVDAESGEASSSAKYFWIFTASQPSPTILKYRGGFILKPTSEKDV